MRGLDSEPQLRTFYLPSDWAFLESQLMHSPGRRERAVWGVCTGTFGRVVLEAIRPRTGSRDLGATVQETRSQLTQDFLGEVGLSAVRFRFDLLPFSVPLIMGILPLPAA
jgi:hypothetical protein